MKKRYTEDKYEISKDESNVFLWIVRSVLINIFSAPLRFPMEISRKFIFLPRHTKLLFLQTCILISFILLVVRMVVPFFGLTNYLPMWCFGLVSLGFLVFYFLTSRQTDVFDYEDEEDFKEESDHEEVVNESKVAVEKPKENIKEKSEERKVVEPYKTEEDFYNKSVGEVEDIALDLPIASASTSLVDLPDLKEFVIPSFENAASEDEFYKEARNELEDFLNNPNTTESDILNCSMMNALDEMTMQLNLADVR